MNFEGLKKLVGQEISLYPRPLVLPEGAHSMMLWRVVVASASRKVELHAPSGHVFDATDVIHHFQQQGNKLILDAQVVIRGNEIELLPMPWGLSASELESRCPTCGAQLVHLSSIGHEYGDTELEVFACGHTRGYQSRPCPRDPRFPSFDDYEVVFSQDSDGMWFCWAHGKTEYARQVALQSGCGMSREDAEKMLKRSYISARDGYDAAHAFMPI